VFFTIQSGLPADGVLSLTLSSINGLKNQATSPTGVSPAEPEFLEALTLLRRIQLSGASTMRVLQSPDKTSTSVMTFRAKDMPDDVRSDITELRRLLKLDPQAAEFNLAFGSAAANDRELAVLTRSLLQIMMLLAVQVDVPPTDLSEGRVVPGWESLPEGAATRWFQVHSATDKPASAFTAVQYRDHWFWVDDTDLRSKRVLSFILLLFTLADTGERESLPLITIPAQ